MSIKPGQSNELLTSALIASLELLAPGFCTLTVLDKTGAPIKLEAATAQETNVMVTTRWSGCMEKLLLWKELALEVVELCRWRKTSQYIRLKWYRLSV